MIWNMLDEWNKTEKKYPIDKTIHQLFEEQVEKSPDNIAVIFEDEQLTYKELNERANRLAHYLRTIGVQPDTLVAIACERSLEIIIGILGILKAGGAYVPLDPSYPSERLKYMLEDTKAFLLLTQQNVLGKLPELDVEIFLLDKDRGKLDGYHSKNPSSITQPHHLAYVIYTSGSTGKPKGVMIEHKNICDRLFWWQDDITLKSTDRFFHQFSFSFDGAVVSLWWPLLNGATVILPTSQGLKDVYYIASLIRKQKATALLATPSIMGMLCDQLQVQQIDSINKIMLAGEIFTQALYQKISQFQGSKIYNFYGPTETTIIATSYDAIGKEVTTASVPIGTPVANTQVYILDDVLNPVPIGVIGELYIGGIGLARGYLNQPELTKERFIKNPFSSEEDKNLSDSIRLYKTGDLCRWLEDGNIEYIGRIDNQVKIRGFRVELGEVEKSLLLHPVINEAVVTFFEEGVSKQQKLISYLTSRDSQSPAQRPSLAEVRAFLAESLPDYMLPTKLVWLDQMPLTINGKIDRQGLSALISEEIDLDKKIIPARDEIDEKLMEIWEESLQQEQITIDNNFFELGGNSLVGTHMISRIAQEFQISISPNVILEYPTIIQLADYIKTHQKEEIFA